MSASARSLLPELGSDPVAAVRAGLPTAALDRLQSHLQVSDVRLAPLLGVSPRTLRRRRKAGTLTPHESDRLVLLAEVVALAQQALDGPDPAASGSVHRTHYSAANRPSTAWIRRWGGMK
jgi:putative toxin-antitoxin system antitoxin component (TIGR02293 family)